MKYIKLTRGSYIYIVRIDSSSRGYLVCSNDPDDQSEDFWSANPEYNTKKYLEDIYFTYEELTENEIKRILIGLI
jgi:hypothetical protein